MTDRAGCIAHLISEVLELHKGQWAELRFENCSDFGSTQLGLFIVLGLLVTMVESDHTLTTVESTYVLNGVTFSSIEGIGSELIACMKGKKRFRKTLRAECNGLIRRVERKYFEAREKAKRKEAKTRVGDLIIRACLHPERSAFLESAMDALRAGLEEDIRNDDNLQKYDPQINNDDLYMVLKTVLADIAFDPILEQSDKMLLNNAAVQKWVVALEVQLSFYRVRTAVDVITGRHSGLRYDLLVLIVFLRKMYDRFKAQRRWSLEVAHRERRLTDILRIERDRPVRGAVERRPPQPVGDPAPLAEEAPVGDAVVPAWHGRGTVSIKNRRRGCIVS
jgi:hypothetical protein